MCMSGWISLWMRKHHLNPFTICRSLKCVIPERLIRLFHDCTIFGGNLMATYVLIHGAFHGGWCWKRVTSRLIAAGHDVYAPTLTGLGERSHLISPAIGLDTHVQDISSLLEYEDLRNVVLVGHSYGGMVISGVAEKLP